MTPWRSKNKKVAHETKWSRSLMFLLRCDGFCAFVTEQTTGKWNLFVLYTINWFLCVSILSHDVLEDRRIDDVTKTKQINFISKLWSDFCEPITALCATPQINDVVCFVQIIDHVRWLLLFLYKPWKSPKSCNKPFDCMLVFNFYCIQNK